MESILEMADKLGQAISESPQAAALRTVRTAMEAESDLMKTMAEYQQQMDKVSQLEQENKPVEVEDKHNLQELHDKLVSSESFKTFQAAQMEYINLMRQVNGALRKQLMETEGAQQ